MLIIALVLSTIGAAIGSSTIRPDKAVRWLISVAFIATGCVVAGMCIVMPD